MYYNRISGDKKYRILENFGAVLTNLKILSGKCRPMNLFYGGKSIEQLMYTQINYKIIAKHVRKVLSCFAR